MRIEAEAFEQFILEILHSSGGRTNTARDEIMAVRSWSLDQTFRTVVGETGPFVLEYEPLGSSQPPDWLIECGGRKISVEVTKITTGPMEAVRREGNWPMEFMHLYKDEQPSPSYYRELRAGRTSQTYPRLPSQNDEHPIDIARNWCDLAAVRLREKYAALVKYRSHFDVRVLLLMDQLLALPDEFTERVNWIARIIRDCAPSEGFDAVILTDGQLHAGRKTGRAR